MKKLLIISTLLIGATAFAVTASNSASALCPMTGNTMVRNGNGMGPGMKTGANRSENSMMGKKASKKRGFKTGYMSNLMTPEQRLAAEKNMISVQEKKLELRKVMLEKTPDWKKVEKLNQEIANIKAKQSTEMMKIRHAAKQAAQAK